MKILPLTLLGLTAISTVTQAEWFFRGTPNEWGGDSTDRGEQYTISDLSEIYGR
ncbi:hypothetical protein [Vibrio aerogenes]|uniref:hypothetical protein n=1 Tax=Vibrio aerogenes TaxID=92172 RepID=UPI0039EFCDFC